MSPKNEEDFDLSAFDELKYQEWLNHPISRQLIINLEHKRNKLNEQAENNAASGNNDLASRTLIKSKTLRDIITYVRTSRTNGTE